MKCPKCKNPRSSVLQTEQNLASTYRRRECLNPRCGHRFSTHEKQVIVEQGPRPVNAESVLEKLKKIHTKQPFDVEALTAAIVTDRRRAEIRRQQRIDAAAEDYDDGFDPAPTKLDRESLKRELGE